MKTRKLPIGIQSFEKLRQENYLYIDKTRYIWDLVERGKNYFLSRPRRFGKSLLISTLEAYFRGQKELFHDLAIAPLEEERGEDAWSVYPVVKFSLAGGIYQDENGLSDMLQSVLQRTARDYDVTISGTSPAVQFSSLIEQLYRKTGKGVVILADEYDKPLLETMNVNETQEEKNRQLYKGFFGVLKDQDQYLKFVFFTGVTKFARTSIFSDLNQLNDISLDDRYAGICGITEEELLQDLQPETEHMAAAQEQTLQECRKELARMYDGYHFSKQSMGVYNPFSLLNAFDKEDYGSYWFSTGTPTFLIRKLRASSFTLEQITEGVEAGEQELTDYRSDDPNPIPLFYQAGYLTITGFEPKFRIYSLAFPNAEVKYGFLNSLVPTVLGRAAAEQPLSLYRMTEDLDKGKTESFLQRLKALFAGIPYPEGGMPDYEQVWRNQLFLIFTLLGQRVQCEVHSARGRADCIAVTDDFVYLIECKLDRSAEEALQQIEEKGYGEPWQADRRKVIRIGINFDSEKRNIEDWCIE